MMVVVAQRLREKIEYAGIGNERVQGGVLPEVEIARLFQEDYVFDSVLSRERPWAEVEGYRSLCVYRFRFALRRLADSSPWSFCSYVRPALHHRDGLFAPDAPAALDAGPERGAEGLLPG